jgi:serine phosphatase RsbU (regulator of sigma subunit)
MLEYSAIKDSILNTENQENLNQMQELYKSEKKDKEILQKNHEIERQTMQNSRQKLFSVFVALVLLLVAAFSLALYNRFKLTKKQKATIEEKQKEIVDSINYARRIQHALMATEDQLKTRLTDHFIFFRPKDIVSGDFYWAAAVSGSGLSIPGSVIANPKSETRNKELFYLAVCDSTGHGVPGAFMSLLNMGFLNEAIREKNIYEPSLIFDYVRSRLVESISAEGQQDGFDGVLLCINKSTGEISYAAANNAPVLVSGNDLIHLPADKMPVGKGEKKDRFTTHTISNKKGDQLFLFTDGLPDQFGGPKGKKFKYKQLYDVLSANSALSMAGQKNALQGKFEDWKGAFEQVDDVLVIGIAL